MALKRVCDITGTDRDVEICDVTIAGQAIKLDLSPAGADKLREIFGPVVTVRHPLTTATMDDETPEPVDVARESIDVVDEEPEPIPAAPAPAQPRARRTGTSAAGKTGRNKATAHRGGKPTVQGTSEIREWARANGFEVRDRGAIPGRIRSAYALSHE